MMIINTNDVSRHHVPSMLTDANLLHDPGDMHHPVARECGPLVFFQGLERKKKEENDYGKLFWNVPHRCVASECAETTDPKVRNDRRYPLCERHKRTSRVECENGDVVCFCFYCYRAHETERFTTKTNICDYQYHKRRRRLEERKTRERKNDQ